MNSECLVEVWGLNIWWSYGLWMFSEAMGFGYLVELWALNVYWVMGFGCLVFKK